MDRCSVSLQVIRVVVDAISETKEVWSVEPFSAANPQQCPAGAALGE